METAKNNGQKGDVELYLHIPFCVKKCGYCDFLSAPSDYETRSAYVSALCEEIRASGMELCEREIRTVFMGGGTPSLLEPALMEQILKTLQDAFCFRKDLEFSIEANPGTLDMEKLKLYHDFGINRLSLGLQSVFEDDLRRLGRIHSYQDFLDSYQLARNCGFRNINVDLMSALPGQSLFRWKENLIQVAALEPEHISAYSLIIEEGTPFYYEEPELPEEELEYEMYEETARVLGEYGFYQYEISNYAKQGFSCRHNIGYWQRKEYLGLGLGAASFYEGKRFSNIRSMKQYLDGKGKPAMLRENIQVLSEREQMEEFMFLGLRMTEGISESAFYESFQKSLECVYGDVLRRYEKSGHLLHEGEHWKFSREGIHVSNWILADFLADKKN